MKPRSLFLGVFAFLATNTLALADLSHVDIASRTDVGTSGYEKITGTAYFLVDQNNPRNRLIADLDLAPSTASGRVEFSADIYILRPKAAAKSNGAALVEVSNRGGKSLLGNFNHGGKTDPVTEADLGDGFLMREGYTLVWVGWEFDVPASPTLLNITVPVARDRTQPITGKVRAQFIVDKRVNDFTVTDLAAYAPLEAGIESAELSFRPSRTSQNRTPVPRDKWHLHGNVVTLDGGFEPGQVYEVAYTAENPPIAGLGFAAIRDTAAWLKHTNNTLPTLRYAYAYGMSQSGRFLRDFLYQGFNTDEHNRPAYDGVIAHIAGAARIDLNRRWSVPRELGLSPVAGFPFADSAQTDPVSAATEGLLENPRVSYPPKVFYTDTSVEYVGGGRVAALVHADPVSKRDLTLPDNVRLYAFSGTQHGPAKFPPPTPTATQQRANPADYWWIMRALIPAMHHWVADDRLPPASVYPQIKDATLTPIADLAFPAVPGVASPRALEAGSRAANPLLATGDGAGTSLPLWVAQVDADGNERGGIRLPEVAVPLGTYTGWNFRSPATGSPTELVLLAGSLIPFPATKAARAASNDPRLSIEERYPTRADYLAQYEQAAQALAKQHLLLPADVPLLVKEAGNRWDWFIKPPAK